MVTRWQIHTGNEALFPSSPLPRALSIVQSPPAKRKRIWITTIATNNSRKYLFPFSSNSNKPLTSLTISEPALLMKLIYPSLIPFTIMLRCSMIWPWTLTTKPKPCAAKNFTSGKTKKHQEHLWHSEHKTKTYISLNLQIALKDRC